MMETFSLDWELAYQLPGSPVRKWVPAVVPGAVQLDVARAEGYGPHEFGENWKDYLWMEDASFLYRSKFSRPDYAAGEKIFFISKGIDYRFEISLNGTLLHGQEGMFSPVKLELNDHLQESNSLEVKVFPIPKKYAEPVDRTQVTESAKPAVSYGWDWHPRLVPSGIWDETFLQVLPASHVEDVHLDYVLSEDLGRAEVRLDIRGREMEECLLTWRLNDPGGKMVHEAEVVHGYAFALEGPELWWPHEQGSPSMYGWELEIRSTGGEPLQRMKGKCAFRRVKLVMNEGGWEDPGVFPKTRSVVPIQLEINGRNIFCKGTNWVNPEIFPGIISDARYGELIDLALEAHFNMLRVWGGGIVNKEVFYQLCDEKGLLVWQEFQQSCNKHEDVPAYLEVLEQEADSIIRRLRKHPSMVLWSGGNELFNPWSGMSDQSLAIRLLNSKCLALDPHTPFIATSPLYGMGHGHYVFRDANSGEEVYEIMNKASCTAYTEFGMPSPADVDILESVIPGNELWPPAPGTSWESHHAYNAWEGDTWLMQDLIEDYFGKSQDLEALVEHGQLLQCEGYRAIYEEARRQKPYCSMALNWCYNEPWPCAANNSILSYPSRPKPAFYAIRDACRPVCASARNYRFKYGAGDLFRCELWVLNDAPEKLEKGKMQACLRWEGGELELGAWDYGPAEANHNLSGPALEQDLDRLPSGRFTLQIAVKDKPEMNAAYLFIKE